MHLGFLTEMPTMIRAGQEEISKYLCELNVFSLFHYYLWQSYFSFSTSIQTFNQKFNKITLSSLTLLECVRAMQCL